MGFIANKHYTIQDNSGIKSFLISASETSIVFLDENKKIIPYAIVRKRSARDRPPTTIHLKLGTEYTSPTVQRSIFLEPNIFADDWIKISAIGAGYDNNTAMRWYSMEAFISQSVYKQYAPECGDIVPGLTATGSLAGPYEISIHSKRVRYLCFVGNGTSDANTTSVSITPIYDGIKLSNEGLWYNPTPVLGDNKIATYISNNKAVSFGMQTRVKDFAAVSYPDMKVVSRRSSDFYKS